MSRMIKAAKTSSPTWKTNAQETEAVMIEGLWQIRCGLKSMEKHVTRSALVQSLRAPATMIWEYREHTKHSPTRIRSKAAIGVGRSGLDLDHVVPFSVAATAMLADDCTKERFEEILRTWLTVCLITKKEHAFLAKIGLRQKMPVGWNWSRQTPYERYHQAGIEPMI